MTPRLLWDNVKLLLKTSKNAYVVFDDTVLDKRYSGSIELVRRQYSGNEPERDSRHWLDSSVCMSMAKLGSFGLATTACMTPMAMVFSLLDHVAVMLDAVVSSKQLPFTRVLLDSWDATQKLMAQIDPKREAVLLPAQGQSSCR